MKAERKEAQNKIDVQVRFANKVGFTFGIRGTTWRFASDNVSEELHRKVSRIFHAFVERPTLKIPASDKLTMVQNLCNRAKDYSDFLVNWTEQRLYAMPQHLTDIDPVPEPKPAPPAKPEKKPRVVTEKQLRNLTSAFQAKYTYPADIDTPEAKKKYRAMMRAEAKKGNANAKKT